MIEEIRKRLKDTNIDDRSLISTDYFNHYNEVIMMFNMLPDMPELLDDIDKWDYMTYREHFATSGLGFGPLAIEAYDFAPPHLRERFEKIAVQMAMQIVGARVKLRSLLAAGDAPQFASVAQQCSMNLQALAETGGSVVHGHEGSIPQAVVDKLF